jgi:hypothetical protein
MEKQNWYLLVVHDGETELVPSCGTETELVPSYGTETELVPSCGTETELALVLFSAEACVHLSG